MALRKPRKGTPPRVSLGGIVHEDLPLPFVHYPGHYGTFFAFSDCAESTPFLCACSKGPLLNYLALRTLVGGESTTSSCESAAHLDQLNLPQAVRLGPQASIDDVRFKKRLCHRCNLTPPTRRWCHEMYGPRFIQHFGWYVDQAYLRFGILPRSVIYLGACTPQELVGDIRAINQAMAELDTASAWFRERMNYTWQRMVSPRPETRAFDREEVASRQDALRRATRKHRRAQRVLSKKIENIVREEFGFRKVGERWTSETLLYQIVHGIFGPVEILRHHRPDWLDGLELDIFIPVLDLAFEYQGQQHFHAIEAWGGKEALVDLAARDEKKACICGQRGITLIAVDYTEPLVAAHIKHRLEQEFGRCPQ